MRSVAAAVVVVLFAMALSAGAKEKLFGMGMHDEATRTPVFAAVDRVDPQTGAARELFRVERQTLAPPAVMGDTLFVGGSDHLLHALDAETGKERWRFDAGHRIFAIVATPGAVLVGNGADLLALNPATGKPLWKYECDVAVNELLAVDQAVLFNSFDGPIAVDLATGKLQWRLDVQWGYFVFSSIGAGRVCIWKPDEIFVVETARGKTLWQSTADVTMTAPGAIPSPAVGDAKEMICQLRGDRKDADQWSLHALDAASGSETWRADLGQGAGGAARTLVLHDAVFCLIDGNLRRLDHATGKLLWQQPLKDAGAVVSLFGAFGSILIPEGNGNLLALNQDAGSQKWLLPRPAAANSKTVISGVAASKDALFVARNVQSEQ